MWVIFFNRFWFWEHPKWLCAKSIALSTYCVIIENEKLWKELKNKTNPGQRWNSDDDDSCFTLDSCACGHCEYHFVFNAHFRIQIRWVSREKKRPWMVHIYPPEHDRSGIGIGSYLDRWEIVASRLKKLWIFNQNSRLLAKRNTCHKLHLPHLRLLSWPLLPRTIPDER